MWFTSYLQIGKSISLNFFYTNQWFLLHYLFLFLYACWYKEENTCTSKQKQKKCSFLLISDNDNNILLDRYSRQSSTTSEDCSCWAILKHHNLCSLLTKLLNSERKKTSFKNQITLLLESVCLCVCACTRTCTNARSVVLNSLWLHKL